MFRTWEEVYQSPEFKRLSPEDQERARVSYFASEIAPFVPPERLGEAADAFDRRWAQVRPTEYAPSRGLLRPASDLLLEGAAQVSGGVGKMIDLAVPDVAPGGTIVPERLGDAPVIGRALPKFMQEARIPDVVRSTVDRAAAHVLTPLAGLYEGAFGEVPEGHPLESGSYRLASMKRGVGGGIQAGMEWLGIDSRAMAEKNAQLGQRLVDMEERENKRRQEAGLEPIHKTRGKQLDSIVRDFFNDVGDGFRLGVSRMAKAQGQEVGQAVEEGYEALAELAFSSPSNFFMVLETAAPSLLASAVPATGFGRGASALSRAAVPANVLSRAAQGRAGARGFVDAIEANAARYGGATGLAAHMTASGANESARFIRDMPQEEIEKLPLYQDVVDQLGPEGAREHLAKLAVDTHLAAGAPLAALVTLGPARLRMNIIEDYLTGASKLNKTSGYLVGAALGLAKGSGAEFSQGFVDSLSQDLAQYSGGLIRADEIGEQALASALLEVISTGPGNAAFGSLQVRQARNLREANQVLQDHLRRARQEVGDNEARRRADPSEVAGNDDAEVLIGEVAETDAGAIDLVAEPTTDVVTEPAVEAVAEPVVEEAAQEPITTESWDGMTIKAREEVAARTGMVTPSGRPNAAARRLARKPFAELTAEERARLSPVATERRADTDTRARIESLPEAEQQTEIQRLRAQVEEQQRQLDTDPLTTVRSVRALNRDIMDGVQATRVYRTGGDEFSFLTADGSVGVIDLDLFKVVNDTIGHAAGDTVLRTVGEILNKYEGDTRSAPEIAQAIQQELDAKKITLDKFDENGNFVQKYEYDGIAASVGTADPSVGANESDPAAIAKARRAAADAASKLDKQRRTEQGIIEERGSKTSRRIRPIGPPATEEGGVLQGQLPGVADVQPVSEVQDAEAQASDVVDQAVTVRDDAGPAAEPGKAAAPEPVRAEPDVATEPETEAVGAEGEGTPEVSRPIQRRPAREERKDESPEAEARRKKRIQDAIDKLKKPKFLRRLNALNRALKASGNSEVTLTETPAELKPLVDRIAKLFGVDTIFVRSDDWNGVNVSPDAIFISDTATDPFVQVMGHELVHAMRRQYPELYQALVEAIRPLMKDSAFASRLAAVRKRARTAKEVAGDKATEEVMADVVGEIVLSNPSMLAGVKPNLIQRVLNFIRKWFDTILKGKSDETYHDVYAAREAVAAILDSWADRTDSENRARVADMGPMFSRPDTQDPKAMQAVISKKAIQAGLNPRAFPKVKFVPSRENMPSKKPGPFLHEGVVYIPSDITPEAAYAGLLRESVKLVGYRNLFNDTQGIDALLERSMQNDEIRDKAQGLARANNLDWPTLGNIQKLAFIERALSGLAQDNSMRLRMQFRLRKALGVSTDLAGSIVRDTYKVNKVAAEIAPSKVKSPTFDDIVAALPKRSIGEMVRSMFEGAADKLIRGRGTKALGLAIRKYVDLKQSYDGMISSVMRKPLKALTDSKRFGRMLADPSSIIKEMTGKSSIETEFDRWAGIWVENEEAGNKVLNTLSPEARAIAEAWMKIADLTGKEMVKQGVEVAETYVDENGRVQIRHRPLRQVKRFMPRMLHERFEQAIQDPLSNPEAWQEVVGILIRNGVVLNEQAAYEYVHKKKTAKRRAAVTGDFMANMELARSEGWPAEMYDYSLRSAMTYLTRWSDRMAQIRAFGQKHKEELFDQTLSRVASSDRRTKDYLSKLQKIIYRDRSLNEGWFYRTLAVLNQLATGLLLGNPGTATLNLIGGSTLNNMAYGRDAIKAYWNLVREFKHINAEMHELGMVSQDFLSLIHDYDSDPQSWLATFVTKTMKYGGYTPTERIIRAHAYVSAKHKLNRSLRAWAKGFDSRESRREAAWAVREGFNPFDLMRDFRENGDLRGEHIDAYLRKAVNLTQGSYKLDQVPLFTDDPIGRFLFKFQKFGTQLSRMFHRHHLVPFMESLAKGGEKVAFVDSNGKEVSFRARNFVNMLTYFGMAVPGGLAVLYARAAAFGYDLPVPDWEEIDKALEDEELGRAFGLAMDMTFQSLIAMGGIGILQTPAVAIKDFSEQRRVPQPTNPPALNSVNQVMGLYWTLLEQGRITGADLQRFVEQTFSGYRNYQRGVMSLGALAGVESDAVRSEYARRNIREVQRLARRYADEQGIGEKRRRAQGFGVSPQTPINRAVVEQLYLDNPGQARAIFVDWLDEIAKEHVGKPGGEERIRAARSSLQSFIRVRQPTIVNTKPDDETRREFLVWAEKNLSARQWNLIKSMDETYRSNARKAFGFLEENERRLENQRASRERVLTQNRVDELKKQWGLDWRSP